MKYKIDYVLMDRKSRQRISQHEQILDTEEDINFRCIGTVPRYVEMIFESLWESHPNALCKIINIQED